MRARIRGALGGFFLVLGLGGTHPAITAADYGAPRIQSRTSLNGAGAGNGSSYNCSISSAGRFLTFDSTATNLSEDLPSGVRQVFLRDLWAQGTALISASSAPLNTPGDGNSGEAAISADGNFVVFASAASELTEGTNTGVSNVFRRDRQSGATIQISSTYDGSHTSYNSNGAAISGDGSGIIFVSSGYNLVASPESNGYSQLYFSPVGAGPLVMLSTIGSGAAASAAIDSAPVVSRDARFVAFSSSSSSFTTGDNNSRKDVFVRDRDTGVIELVSLAPNGTQFSNDARTLGPSSLSSDGRFVLFAVEQGPTQIYLRDRTAGTTQLISANLSGEAGNNSSSQAKISGDGRYVVFRSAATNLVSSTLHGGIFLLDRDAPELILVDIYGSAPCISDDASVIGYDKFDLPSAQNQIFVRALDQCPQNPNKEIPGVCGCASQDTDGDKDGTLDCIDGCPLDKNKSAKGVCGCGVPDADKTGNGAVDCLESWFRPKKPTVKVKGSSVTITMKKLSGVRWQVVLKQGKKSTTRTYRTSNVGLTKLKRGSYTVTYRMLKVVGKVLIPGALSPQAAFRIR